jgi:hypothetical protein
MMTFHVSIAARLSLENARVPTEMLKPTGKLVLLRRGHSPRAFVESQDQWSFRSENLHVCRGKGAATRDYIT